jgi:Tfp pilus assembly protein PilV
MSAAKRIQKSFSRLKASVSQLKSEAGTTLIETAIAMGILVTAMAGLAGMFSMATSIVENQGHLSARTTEYAV